MIESIEFRNFKALRNTTLPLAPFTLLLGPNGSGKTSVLQAINQIVAASNGSVQASIWKYFRSATNKDVNAEVAITLRVMINNKRALAQFYLDPTKAQIIRTLKDQHGGPLNEQMSVQILNFLQNMRTFALDSSRIGDPVQVTAGPIDSTGGGLAAVLDDLKDNHPERWESLLAEMRVWLPEYDHIMFDKPQSGQKAIVLRTKKDGHRIIAKELSQGTLIALALLTLAYLPNPPSLIGLEEIDRGLHPRLLRHLQDALYRLSYPESCGEKRPAVQVIATTHSPYLLDLYREHPEEVVLAQKEGLEVQMRRLKDIEHYEEILGESPLSEVWYSGVLGGVAVKP